MTPLSTRTDVLARAREAHKAQEAKPKPPPKPSELQETAARDAGRVLETEVDPLTVKEHGRQDRYQITSVTVDGVTITGHYLWGGRDQRYHFAGSLQASVEIMHKGRFRTRRRLRAGAVHNLADVGRLLDA